MSRIPRLIAHNIRWICMPNNETDEEKFLDWWLTWKICNEEQNAVINAKCSDVCAHKENNSRYFWLWDRTGICSWDIKTWNKLLLLIIIAKLLNFYGLKSSLEEPCTRILYFNHRYAPMHIRWLSGKWQTKLVTLQMWSNKPLTEPRIYGSL